MGRGTSGGLGEQREGADQGTFFTTAKGLEPYPCPCLAVLQRDLLVDLSASLSALINMEEQAESLHALPAAAPAQHGRRQVRQDLEGVGGEGRQGGRVQGERACMGSG